MAPNQMNGTTNGSTRTEMEWVSFEDEDDIQGQVELLETIFAFAKSMALKSAILLGIPDALASKGSPNALFTLEEIALKTKAKNTDVLFRILRFLSRNRIFTEKQVVSNSKVEYKYGLTRASKWLVTHECSISPFAVMQLDKDLQAPWHHFHECVALGEEAFDRAHGKNIWSFAAENPGFNDLFNDAMVSSSSVCTASLLKHYKGFQDLKTLVDVGGGLGLTISKIVGAYPGITGFNFDLPHVVATAPPLPGVEHVGGDMFERVPPAEAIIMKWIMHDWDDDRCAEILHNCHSALPANGKIIIVEAVLEATHETGTNSNSSPFSNIKMVFDLLMIAHAPGGRERTRQEWLRLLNASGFPTINIHQIPNLQFVIEAFKQ